MKFKLILMLIVIGGCHEINIDKIDESQRTVEIRAWYYGYLSGSSAELSIVNSNPIGAKEHQKMIFQRLTIDSLEFIKLITK